MTPMKFDIVAQDLGFPEGPFCLPDGSVQCVEIEGRCLTHIDTAGRKRTVAQLGGGPNGAALGPDGWVYVCNNGGLPFPPRGTRPMHPTGGMPDDYSGGRIERVHPVTGEHGVLCSRIGSHIGSRVGAHTLRGPNDIVFDRHGGFWFTDLGKRRGRDIDYGGLYYARADGSAIHEVVYPLLTPNGVGLSPDGRTVYVAETWTARVWAWDIAAPGEVLRRPDQQPGRLLYTGRQGMRFDSMAVEADGNLCVATIDQGAISVISPAGQLLEQHAFPDPFTTNLCFGGADMRTAYVTLSSTGQLVACRWPRPGLALALAG